MSRHRIEGKSARLDAAAIGVPVTAFTAIGDRRSLPDLFSAPAVA